MKISRTIKSASMILGISLSVFLVTFIVFAFSGPSQNPPACPAGEPGCDAPLHIGTAGQVKDGPLGIEGVFRAYSNLIVDGNVGIGTANPTTRLEVDGNIIASAPTASNHLTTKAYVDAQAGGGGGCPSEISPLGQYNSVSFMHANYYCKNMEGGDWRLPTAEELGCFFYDNSATTHTLWTRTPFLAAREYWDGSGYVNDYYIGWAIINLSSGEVNSHRPDSRAFYRCVRG